MLDRETKKKKKIEKNVNLRGKEVETEENMMKSLVRYRKAEPGSISGQFGK